MLEDLQAYLDDILRFSAECQTFLEGKSYLAYCNDPRLRRAVERSLQIVGEAVWQAIKVSPSFTGSVSDTARIVGLRHRLVHDYRTISDGVIYTLVQQNVPGLQEEVRNLLTALEAQGARGVNESS